MIIKKKKKIAPVAIALVLVSVIIVVAVVIFAGGTSSVKTAVANAALENIDLEETVTTAVDANKAEIASTLGTSEEQVDEIVSNLDLANWKVTELPSDAVAVNTVNGDYNGQPVTATVYDDPSYVTAEVSGMTLTFAVPEDAQSYVTQMQ